MITIKHILSTCFAGLISITFLICCKTSTPAPAVASSMTDFIKKNPSRSSLFLMRNDSIKINIRADQKFPLASTVKIIIAIEFAKQVNDGRVKANELINIADLDLFYIPDTDRDAHPNWKKNAQSRNQINDNKVTLQEVVKGMIWFSSNANTEYLMDKSGLDNINSNLTELNLTNHDKIYHFVSALCLYSTNNAISSRVSQLSLQQYQSESSIIHAKLKADIDGSYKKSLQFSNDLDWQKLWSDRLPSSTTAEYGSVMQKILNQNYYSKPVRDQLDSILQSILELAPANKDTYQNLYTKGGSTSFVLTYAVGAKLKSGSKTVMVVFFNNLTPDEQSQLQGFLNTFLINCTQGENYKTIIADLQ